MNKQCAIIITVTTVLLVNFIKFSSGQRDVGDGCVLASSGLPGTCKLLSGCEQALKDLRERRMFPQNCGYEGTVPIVCCVESGGSSQPSQPSQPSRPTTTSRPTRPSTSRPSRPNTPQPSRPLPSRPNIPAPQPSRPEESKPSISSGSRAPGDISKEKCKEYAKLIEIEPEDVTLLFKPPKADKQEKCTFKVVKLILGGEIAALHEFPHMALIGGDSPDGKIWLCGGTLISNRYVLTAGHCLYSRDFGEPKYVRLGVNNVNDRAYRQDFRIEEMFAPDGFEPPSHYDDIALLKLDRRVEMGPYVRPACLYTEKEITAEKTIATGWGVTSYSGTTSQDLLKVTLEFFDHATCNESYKNNIGRKLRRGILDETQVCGGSYEDKKDTCQGDSGGPIQIYSVEDELFCTYKVVGVTSFGKNCGVKASPGVYTRVSAYIKWIEDIVWPN